MHARREIFAVMKVIAAEGDRPDLFRLGGSKASRAAKGGKRQFPAEPLFHMGNPRSKSADVLDYLH